MLKGTFSLLTLKVPSLFTSHHKDLLPRITRYNTYGVRVLPMIIHVDYGPLCWCSDLNHNLCMPWAEVSLRGILKSFSLAARMAKKQKDTVAHTRELESVSHPLWWINQRQVMGNRSLTARCLWFECMAGKAASDTQVLTFITCKRRNRKFIH